VAEPYVAQGTYQTPAFDSAAPPGLTSSRFTSTEEGGSSIDTAGSLASSTNTLNARASNSPPNTNASLGTTSSFKDALISYRLNSGVNTTEALGHARIPSNVTTWSLGVFNSVLSASNPTLGPDGDDKIENFGAALFYHESKDELWSLNVMLSGSLPSAIYPVWDRYDLESGALIGTQAVGGIINYSYRHPEGADSADFDSRIFEPVCFLPDYDREEIYIIQRENAFFIASESFYGIKTDLNGNFKSVIWSHSDVINSLPADGVNREQGFNQMRDITYDGTYFYALTDFNHSFGLGSSDGLDIYIYRWGLADGSLGGSDPDRLTFKQRIEISTVPGFGFATSSRPARLIEYNSRDGLFYLGFESSDQLYAMSIVPDENEVFSAQAAGPQATAITYGPFPAPLGFEAAEFGANPLTKLNNWIGAGQQQAYRYLTDMAYVPSRNSFITLTMVRSERTRDWFDLGVVTADFFFYRYHNHSFVTEVGAGGVFTSTLPSIPSPADGLWGTLSGTLDFQLIQENSALFPTGQFSQMEYVLNSDDGRTISPYLLKSEISQGLRVENIPAQGTRPIYLRTNIPEGTSVASQTGRLKVFWELIEG
jgi:hypothetical protein